MDLLNNLALGFSTAFSLTNLLYCFIGVTLGTLIWSTPWFLAQWPPWPCFCRSPILSIRRQLSLCLPASTTVLSTEALPRPSL